MTRKQILMTLLWAVVAGIPAGILAHYTGISVIAPLGAAAGAAYAFQKYKGS